VLRHPGVYIEEVPSGVRTIVGVATSITAFVGRATRGPVDEPVRVQSFGEYERRFGGLSRDSTMSYAVQQFFLNGGSDALIVRVENGGDSARFALAPESGTGDLTLDAASPGAWANQLRIAVDHDTRPLTSEEADQVFNLTVIELDPVTGLQAVVEVFRNVSIDANAPRFVGTVLAQESNLIVMPDPQPAPAPSVRPGEIAIGTPAPPDSAGGDGDAATATQVEGNQGAKTGIFALEKADLFNLLVIPPYAPGADVAKSTWDAAAAYCKARRAVLLVDPPAAWNGASDVTPSAIDAVATRDENAALYFPRLRVPDPLQENRLSEFVPSGAVAGLISRTDAQRGVWKAPAGIEATLTGVAGLTVAMTDGENGQLNPQGVNCLRQFPGAGRVVWGARTLRGADQLASEWKYLPVRRLALFIEESLFRGTQWVVFEPNDEPLWAQIRLNLGAFMQNLFRQGAFQGSTPRDAYFVKCDRETTTQADINLGIVNIHVGFAPLKPAEFVVIRIQQMAGQLQT
jgi:phage tail sheath protein FI